MRIINRAGLIAIQKARIFNRVINEKRKRGRPKSPPRPPETRMLRYDLTLTEKFAEWGKTQPGGLSALVRDLLREAYEQAHDKTKATK